jgi:hypothetical protein
MYIALDFIDNDFHLKRIESISNLSKFFNFSQSIGVENLKKVGEIIHPSSFAQCYVLLLYGYITLEAEKEIKKQLKIN